MTTKSNKKADNVNGEVLDLWIRSDDRRILALMKRAGLSIFTIQQMRTGIYKHYPKPFTRLNMSKITGIPESQLFPFTAQKSAEQT